MKYFLRQLTPNENINVITIPLVKDNIRIGRKTVSQLSQYPQISREHAEFHRTTSGTLFVRDLNSSNGLFVNGKQVGTSLCEVNIGDIIGFGVPFLEDENGFVCILCSLCNPAVVKHEVILISDEEECRNNNRHSNLVALTSDNESRITFTSPKCIKQDVMQSTSNCSSVIQPHKVPETASSLKSSDSVLYMNSVSENDESEQDIEVRNTVNHALDSSQINLNVLKNILVKKLPVIFLVRCDSEDFEWPKDVRNTFKKQKFQDDSSHLKPKRRRIKKLSSDSDSNEESPSQLSVHKNQNMSPYNNTTKNSILLCDFKKRKKSVKDISFSSKKQLKHDVGKGNFSCISSESILRNGIEKPIIMTVQQKDMYQPLNSIDNEIGYSQVEDVMIISDEDAYLDFSSSQNSIHIKEPTDTNEDMYNQDDLCREIFDAESEYGSRVETFVQSNSYPESIESIRKFVEDTEQKSKRVVNNEADHCDLEMHCSEESDSDDNFESEVFCTAKIPLELKEKNNYGSLDSKLNKGKTANKPVRRTLLTEAKPMQQRPYKIRGKEEGFIEQNQYHEPVQLSTTKKSEISRKSRKKPVKVQKNTSSAKQEVIKIDSMSSNLKNFKIPHKQKVQTVESHIDLKARNTYDSSQLNSSSSKKKAAPVSIESIRKFVQDTEQKSEKVVDNAANHCDLEMYCSEESDLGCNFESEVFCTTKIPFEAKDKNGDCNLNSKLNKSKPANKPVRRTLLTEAKPMQQRPYKIRGREEGFIEQNQYHEPVQLNTTKKSEISRKTSIKVQNNTSSAKREVIKIDGINSNLKNFKNSLKSDVQNAQSHIDLKARNTPDNSQLNSSGSKKNNAPVSIESIRKFVEDTEQKSEKVVNNEADHCDLEMYCSEESDSGCNFESEVFCTTKIPFEAKDKNGDCNLNSKLNKSKPANKPVRRTLLTEAKPMQQRPYKIRGREEGFIEQNQYHEPVQLNTTKKSEISRKTSIKVQNNTSSAKREVIKIDGINSNLKNFKNSLKSDVQNAQSHIDLKARNTPDNSQLNSSGSKKNNAPVSIESIRKFVEDTEQKSEKVVNNEADHCDLEMYCSEESDSGDNFESEVFCTAKIPFETKDKYNDCSLNSKLNKGKTANKPVRRTLLTEAKPMQQRPYKIRGREEGFIEQNQYHEPVQLSTTKKSEISRKSRKKPVKVQKNTSSANQEVIKIDSMSSILKNFKIPHKQKVQTAESHIDLKARNTSDSNQLNSSSSKKKAAPVKTRPEKFGSRMAFLVDNSEIKPIKSKKSHETRNLPNHLHIR